MLPGGQSGLRAASARFLRSRRPRLFLQLRPFPAAGPRVRRASRTRAPLRTRAPGERGGGAGAEGWLEAEEEAAPASAQAQK